MAIMHPEDIENYNYTESEKYMYMQLKEQLNNRYHVFYSVRWFEMRDNKRVDSESDFIVFDPSFGYLTIEVKGGISITVSEDNDKWVLAERVNGELSHRILKCSPYEQAEKSMRHFYDYFFQEFNQTFYGAYGFAVAFPWYSSDTIITSSSPRELTIDQSDMDNLQAKINEVFHYWRNKRNMSIPFSEEQRNRFISLIKKRISLSAAAGALIDIKSKEFDKINSIQDGILDALDNYSKLQFVGGAGTGKTFIGAKKAVRDREFVSRVLYVCSSKQLAAFVKSQLLDGKDIQCMSFNELIKTILGEHQSVDILDNNGEFSTTLSGVKLPVFDTIIVDEAQDFSEDMGLCIEALLSPTYKTLYVFFDENQNIFSRDFGRAFDFKAPPIILRYNIRNTARIYEYATNQTGLGTDTVANTLLGVEPEIANYSNKSQALKAITNIVNRLTLKEGVPIDSVILLSNLPYDKSIFRNQTSVGKYGIDKSQKTDIMDCNSICFFEADNFKGLESNVVIYINHIVYDASIDEQIEYVALTRARYYLYIINVKEMN